ncbi:MAG TPA: YdiU family protein [Myxococcaceae bacterium]|nr:YdiU family protein [Myxococcaceae bacterium]
MATLETLQFDNSYARLPEAFFSRVAPSPFPAPYRVSFNPDAARLLDLDAAEADRPDFAEYLSGLRPLPGADPVAMVYAGHQFGFYVPRLGDGRALLLGEVVNRAGERWELHLKGGGPTPYSRGGDGRAVLRSTIREYLCGEAMHGLGVPTTRALCILGADAPVYREDVEPAAMLVRLSPSHVRFGTFEYFANTGPHAHLATLADHVIGHHLPELRGRGDRHLRLFEQAIERTADLIARWQAVGFAHGVMNTDNMSILGLTLDYGPFGFLDDYDPGFICNHSDERGRYAFGQQPRVGLWNLACLAEALLPLMPLEEARPLFEGYLSRYEARFLARMREKLGLREERPQDEALVQGLLSLLAGSRADYPTFFRALGGFDTGPGVRNEGLRDRFIDREAFDVWAAGYRGRLLSESSHDGERKARMDRVNPAYVLRNYLAQQAIERAERERDFSEIDSLLELLRDPFTERLGMDRYAAPPPDWGKRLAVSCSS